MMTAEILARNLAKIREEIQEDGDVSNGETSVDVSIIAVTKTQEPNILSICARWVFIISLENRVEHLDDMQCLAIPGDRWHFIGRVQDGNYHESPNDAQHA